jgi:predicted metal-dependent peptidase
MSGVSGAFHGALAMSLVPAIRTDIETAATDGKHFFYNATWFDSLSERERVGVLVHEIRHLIALHHCRRNGRDLSEFNVAADYAINPGIVADGFKLPEGVLIDPQYVGLSAEEIFRLRQVQAQQSQQAQQESEESKQPESRSDSSDDASQEEGTRDESSDDSSESSEGESSDDTGDKSDESGESSEGESNNDQGNASDQQGDTEGESSDQDNESNEANGQGNGKQGDDSSDAEAGKGKGETSQANYAAPISDPGSCGGIMDAAPTQDAAAMAQAESDIDQRIRQAIAVARKANGGELPGDLARLVGELKAPKLDARDMLRRFIDRSIQKSYAWTRPNKRYLSHGLTLPSLISDRPGHIVALVDVSGSLWSDAAQAALTSELQGALDNGAADQITVVYADTDVTGSAEYFPGDQIEVEAEGGGGTDFAAPLQWVADNCENVAAILYLTDMQTCDFGEEPDAPILWLVCGDPREAKYYVDRVPFGEVVYIDE